MYLPLGLLAMSLPLLIWSPALKSPQRSAVITMMHYHDPYRKDWWC